MEPVGTYITDYNITSKHDIIRKDHGGAVVTHSLLTSEVGSSNPGLCLGNLIVSYR